MTMAATGAVEVNFDGLVGPTHNYGGLSLGNVASMRNADAVSDPRTAALQGLAKMRRLIALGLPQGVLPPQERPHLGALRRLGFSGSDRAILADVARADPALLRNVSAASAMWTANAATVSPSADCRDGRVHLTVANLATMFHRALEADTTERVLRRIFADPAHFAVHAALPAGGALGDEGAANHGRLAAAPGLPGVELFVHGRSAFDSLAAGRRYPPRQALEAGQAVARGHGLDPARTLHLRQAAAAIEAGAFHNDVVSVAHDRVLFTHARAFEDPAAAYDAIRAACVGFEPVIIEVPEDAVGLPDAIGSYLFNSQLVTLPGADGLALILPTEAADNPRTSAYLDGLVASGGPIRRLEVLDLRQSMRNGGGPACLRLRVVLTEAERRALGGRVLLDAAGIDRLEGWVRRHYRDRLAIADLADPDLLEEGRRALDELTGLLDLGSLYDFQRA